MGMVTGQVPSRSSWRLLRLDLRRHSNTSSAELVFFYNLLSSVVAVRTSSHVRSKKQKH